MTLALPMTMPNAKRGYGSAEACHLGDAVDDEHGEARCELCIAKRADGVDEPERDDAAHDADERGYYERAEQRIDDSPNLELAAVDALQDADCEDDTQNVGQCRLDDEHRAHLLAGAYHAKQRYDDGRRRAATDKSVGCGRHGRVAEPEVHDACHGGGRYGEEGGCHYHAAAG